MADLTELNWQPNAFAQEGNASTQHGLLLDSPNYEFGDILDVFKISPTNAHNRKYFLSPMLGGNTFTPKDVITNTGSKCSHPDCAYLGPFVRPADLERHAKLHKDGPKESSRYVPGCDRTGTKGFIREDKLQDHVRKGHRGYVDLQRL
ncbi:MAG: hypothetical protein MMC33_004484 [Icmadophila ericetorum]|nr:hypothetical protein [Icmadophila ericetorum]